MPLVNQTQATTQTLGETLLAAADVLREVFHRATAAEGLSLAEGRALRLALVHGEQAQIINVLGVAPPRMSEILRTLERRGFVSRSPSASDRRHRVIEVTAAGRESLSRIFAILDAQSPLMTELSPAQRDALHDLLIQLLPKPDQDHTDTATDG